MHAAMPLRCNCGRRGEYTDDTRSFWILRLFLLLQWRDPCMEGTRSQKYVIVDMVYR